MKLALALALSVLAAGPLFAQTMPAPAPAAAPAPAPATAPKYTLDTPIETIAADPAGKAVLDADMPGLTTHASYDMFKSMSLTQLAPMSQGKITEAGLARAAADLAAIK